MLSGSHLKKEDREIRLFAAKGEIEPLLKLISQGVKLDISSPLSKNFDFKVTLAQKSPLYVALENHQWLAVQVLLICGADKTKARVLAERSGRDDLVRELKNLTMDPTVLQTMLMTSVYRNNEALLDAIQPVKQNDIVIDIDKDGLDHEKYNLSGLLEWAAQKNATQLATQLFILNGYRCNLDLSQPTFGYWAAKNNNHDLLALIANDDKQISAASKQLFDHGDYVQCEKYFKNRTATQQKEFEELALPSPDLKLTQRLNNILTSLQLKKDNFFKIEKELNADNKALLKAAFANRHFTALETLMQYLSKAQLIEFALAEQHREMLLFFMFITNQFTYELMHHFPEKRRAIFNLLGKNSESEGFLYRIVRDGIDLSDSRNSNERKQQVAYFKEQNITNDQFVKIYSQISYDRNDMTSVDELEKYVAANRMKAYYAMEHGKRFGLNLRLKVSVSDQSKALRSVFETSSLTKQWVFKFLNNEDKARLASVSRSLYHDNHSFRTVLSMVNLFFQQLEREIKQKRFYQGRNRGEVVFFVVFMIAIVGLIVSAIFFKKTASQIERILQKSDPISGCFLHDYNYNRDITESCSRIKDPTCESLCYDLRDAHNLQIGPLLGLTLSGGMLGIYFLPYLIAFALRNRRNCIDPTKLPIRGRERFDNFSLTYFSPALKKMATEIFNELKDHPEFKLSLNSSVKEVRDYFKEAKEDLKFSTYGLMSKSDKLSSLEVESKQSLVPALSISSSA